MARKFDLARLKKRAQSELDEALRIVARVSADKKEYLFARWTCKMVAVGAHATWERYVEHRAAAALNHHPTFFLGRHDVRGVSNISSGFAYYIVRGGNRYFDFRTMGDLYGRVDDWLSRSGNPFRNIDPHDAAYIDALAAIRNMVAHGSDASFAAYKRHLKNCYSIDYPPQPDEFLFAKDNRPTAPVRYQSRIVGLIGIIGRAILRT